MTKPKLKRTTAFLLSLCMLFSLVAGGTAALAAFKEPARCAFSAETPFILHPQVMHNLLQLQPTKH